MTYMVNKIVYTVKNTNYIIELTKRNLNILMKQTIYFNDTHTVFIT